MAPAGQWRDVFDLFGYRTYLGALILVFLIESSLEHINVTLQPSCLQGRCFYYMCFLINMPRF